MNRFKKVDDLIKLFDPNESNLISFSTIIKEIHKVNKVVDGEEMRFLNWYN